jgi:cytoskeletal protein CcmA (bactofilin family)
MMKLSFVYRLLCAVTVMVSALAAMAQDYSGAWKGNITAGELYANGARIEGDVKSYGSVKVGVGSMIIGGIEGESAVIAGAVNGEIDVKGPVIVDSTAVIMGNIKSRSVQINNGAVIEGFCSQSYSDIDVKSFFA